MEYIYAFLGYGMQNVWYFWGCFAIAFIAVILALNKDLSIWTYALFHAAAVAAIVFYFRRPGELLWHVSYDYVGLILVIIGIVFYSYIIGSMWGLAIGHLRNITSIFDYPLSAIGSVIIGLGWAYSCLQAVVCFASEHPILLIFLIVGLANGNSHAPTIYVHGEGHITGRGYHGGDRFHGDNGRNYGYDGDNWHPLR